MFALFTLLSAPSCTLALVSLMQEDFHTSLYLVSPIAEVAKFCSPCMLHFSAFALFPVVLLLFYFSLKALEFLEELFPT